MGSDLSVPDHCLSFYFSNGPSHTTSITAMPMYGKNHKKILLWNQNTDDLTIWYAASGIRVLPILFR